MKSWRRWTESTKEFPKPKYGFSQYLKKIGDYIETEPIPFADYVRMNDAAKFWAWYHGKRVKVRSYDQRDGTRVVNVMLVSHTREREYD